MNKDEAVLKAGIVGKKLYDYFLNYGGSDSVPVTAEALEHVNETQMRYRMTFDDGRVSDWLVTFEPNDPEASYEDIKHEIVSAECYNEVI